MEKDNELKGFGNSLDFGARIYDSRLGRWLSIDPLAAKYPSMSPYNFVANSPLMFIDPDGREIWISYLNTETTMNIERVRYSNGKLYTTEGKEVTSNNAYVNEIKTILDNIYNISYSVGEMIKDLQDKEGVIHNISNISPKFLTGNANINYATYSDDMTKGTWTIFNSSNIQKISTKEASLAHELKHAHDRQTGLLNTNKVEMENGETFLEAEYDAVNVQNQILFNQGKSLRKDYEGILIPKDRYLTPKDKDKPKNLIIEPSKPKSVLTETKQEDRREYLKISTN